MGRRVSHVGDRTRYEEIAILLIERGADLTAEDIRHRIPLHMAAFFGYERVVKIILEKEQIVAR
jgi:ankyrin repeat protein